MSDPFQGLASFSELVVVETNEPPRNVLLSTSSESPTLGHQGRFYVWRHNAAFKEPVETAVVPLEDNALFNEVVVIESIGAPRGVLLSTSYQTPVVHRQDQMYVWKPPPSIPTVSGAGTAAMFVGLAAAGAVAIRKRCSRKPEEDATSSEEPSDA